jgi:hypothetical protein
MSRSLFGAALLPLLVACNPTESTDMGVPPGDPQVRLGHFLDGYPALDACIRGPGDAAFIGPIVRSKLMRSGGVPFGYTSGYITVSPGTYDVRVVSGMATDCSTSFLSLPDQETEPLEAGRRYTMVGMGNQVTLNIRFLTLEDDVTVLAGQARLRMVHAVSATYTGSLDFGRDSGASFFGLLTASGYGTVGEALGQAYVSVTPMQNATYSVRSTGQSSDIKAFTNKITLNPSEAYTAWLTTYVPGPELQLSLCSDSAAASSGLSQCQGIR